MTVNLQKINCTNCGAPIDWDGTFGKTITCPFCGTTFLPAASQEDDVWLMTDPVARARYEFEGKLDKLEHDIRFEVLRGGTWSDLDREYLHQINALEQQGMVRKLASFWSISPHPTVYRALQDGSFQLGGKTISFRKGEEIIWACPMTRDHFDLDLPVLVADLQDSRVQMLCGKMANAMQGRMA